MAVANVQRSARVVVVYGTYPNTLGVVPFVRAPSDVTRVDGNNVRMGIGEVDDHRALDFLVAAGDGLVQCESYPLVQTLYMYSDECGVWK